MVRRANPECPPYRDLVLFRPFFASCTSRLVSPWRRVTVLEFANASCARIYPLFEHADDGLYWF